MTAPPVTAIPFARDARHITRLDGFRGVSILLVLVGHVVQFSLGRYGWGQWGGLGVLLFFLLSGFLITTLLLRERAERGDINLRAFYQRRALRILPAALLFLGTVSLLMLAGWITDVTWGGVAASLLFVRNLRGRGESIGHMWSLSIEEQFYLLWPLALTRLNRRRAFIGSSCLILACWTWRMYAIMAHLYPYEGGKYYIRTDFRVDSILIGCWIAIAWSQPDVRARLIKTARQFHPLLLVPALGAWSFYAERLILLRPIYLTVQTVLASMLFVWILSDAAESLTTRSLSHPLLVWLGRLSYSLYLWQQIFLVTQVPSWGPIRLFPMNILITFAAAATSFYALERPALQLKRRYSAVITATPAT